MFPQAQLAPPSIPQSTPLFGHRKRLLRAAPALVLLLAAPVRLWAAVGDHGIFWPDEIFQTLEPAHRFAFGTGVLSWEFRDGARSWLMPGAIGLLWKLLAALGVQSGLGLVTAAKLTMAALSLIGVGAGMAMARRLGGRGAELAAGLLLAAFPPLIFYGSRVMTESASAPLLMLAFHLAFTARKRHPATAGALAGLAVFLRYQNGLVALGLLAVLVARRERQALWRTAGAMAAVGLLGGALDGLTWGTPFHSFWVYVKFNLIDGKASNFGTAPFWFYAEHLQRTVGLSLGLVALGLALGARRFPGLAATVGAYVLAHCLIPHKELRFLVPVMPLALALAGVGLAELLEALVPGPRLVVAVSGAAAAFMGAELWHPTQRDYGRSGMDIPVWRTGGDYFQLEVEAARDPALCGIALVGNGAAWTGGYAYLHRDVPLFFHAGPRELASANAVIGKPDEALPPEYRPVATAGSYALFRRPGLCAPAPEGHQPHVN